MTLSRRSLLGLAAAAPAAAAVAGPSGFVHWLTSLLKGGGGSYGFGGMGTWRGHGTVITGSQILCGSISAEKIGVNSILAEKLVVDGYGNVVAEKNPLGVFATQRRYRPEVATNMPLMREVQADEGRLLYWEGGLIEVNPGNSWTGEIAGFSGLYMVAAGSCQVRNASQIALTLESDEDGSRLVPISREDVPDLSGRCVVSVWSSDVLGVDSRITGSCREWPDQPRPEQMLTASVGERPASTLARLVA